MALIHKIYVFGDQTFNIEQSLRALLRCNHALLIDFFERTSQSLRQEIGRQPSHVRDHLPRFSSIADLITRSRDGQINPAVAQALCVIHAFACFIKLHLDGSMPYPSSHDSHLAGLCSGALAAAAISTSSSLHELIPTAVQTVVLALHIGLRAAEMAQSLEASPTGSTWSMVIPGLTSEAISQVLDDFCSKTQIPKLSRPFVTAYSAAGVTVSGPPHTLQLFRNSVGTASMHQIPINAPYHAPHLYGDEDVTALLERVSSVEEASGASPAHVVSFGTGHPVWSGTAHYRLREAVRDILLRPILWDQSLLGYEELFKSKKSTEIRIIQIGTHAGDALQRHLIRALPDVHATVVNNPPEPVAVSETDTSRGGRPKLAVVGMGGRFPGASSPDALWTLLMDKVDTCKEVPPLRWDTATHVDPTGKAKNTSKIRWGCWLDDADKFDAKFFSMSPREAPQVDPAQRIALMTAYEAMEQAGLVPGRTPSTREDRVGVFFGTTSNDWCEANSGQDIDTYFIPGANRAFIPGRINYCFKFTGPSYSVDTACSSSLSALHIACNALWRGDVDTAIVGGTNVLTNPDMTAGLDKGHFLSPTGNCKTFDATADGYCRGEGVATVIIKRLEDAIEDNDPIQGVIGGAFTNHSAEAESITRPHVGAQKSIFERVLHDSGTEPYDVGYIEMHGTGTQAGDSREMQSVLDIFAPDGSPHKRTMQQSLHLGALKSNIGHGESVSGVSALIKVLTMMQKRTITPHCGIKTVINPRFPKNLAERNVHIALEATSWESNGRSVRKAFINNFSAAGGNSSVLVEEAPRTLPKAASVDTPDMARSCFPVAVSARCPASLEGNLRAILSYLDERDPSAQLISQLSYTTTARRMHHPHRVMVSASSIAEVKTKFNDAISLARSASRAIPPKTMLFAFTGQGSQYPGMGKQLYETLSVFRHRLNHFDRLCSRLGFPHILPLFTANSGANIADYDPVVVQLANVCMQVALASIWISWGITPTATIGHSLGEYAALNIAGVLSDIDTVYLVGRRATLLQQKCNKGTHAMLAAFASESRVHDVAREQIFETACINGESEVVLSGTVEQMAKLQHTLTNAGIRNTILKVPYAFHSSQIQAILADFTAESQSCEFHRPRIPVLSPLLGQVVTEQGILGPDYMARHAREPVNMLAAVRAGSNAGLVGESTVGIEFGPHPVVSEMIKGSLGSKLTMLPTLRRNRDVWETLTQTLSALYNTGLPIKWDEYFHDLPSARTVLHLPAYSWDLKSYWIKYRNDWTLTKGDIVSGAQQRSLPTSEAEAKDVYPKVTRQIDKAPVLETTSIHRIVEEKTEAGKFVMTVETNVSRPDVNPLMQGHRVEGIGLCTPSVYADIAFTLGNYLLTRFKPNFPERTVDVSNMATQKALIAPGKEAQYLRVTLELDWSARCANCRFYTADSKGIEVMQHSTCQIKFVSGSLFGELQQNIDTVTANFERMRQSCVDGRTFRFNGPMAYNMVQALADFHPDYRCIDETIYDNDAYEAACTVSFGQMKEGGSFHTHPGAIDGLTQSGGFVMNANEKTNLQTEVFVNHGWDSFQIYEKIRSDCQYKTHVRMKPAQDKQWKGDIVVLTGDRIVASIKGVCLQGVPRRILKYILTSAAAPAKTKDASRLEPLIKRETQQRTVVHDLHPRVTDAAASAAEVVAKSTTLPVQQVKPMYKDSLASKAVGIIASQSEIPESDLKDDVFLADIGVDSLLSLTIAGAFSEDLDVETDPSFFESHPSIGDIKRFFSNLDTEVTVHSVNTESQRLPEPRILQPASPISGRIDHAKTGSVDLTQQTSLVPKPTQIATTGLSKVYEQALKIIAEESGLRESELTDDTALLDAGVDSLLSLVIGGRFREELGIDLEPEVLLGECPTLADLKQRLGGHDAEPANATAAGILGNHLLGSEPASTEDILNSVAEVTRRQSIVAILDEHVEMATRAITRPLPTSDSISVDVKFLPILQIISEETGTDVKELSLDTYLGDIGVDSLLGLVIGGRLREELSLDLDLESFLGDQSTLRDLKAGLETMESASETPPSSASSLDDDSQSSIDTRGIETPATMIGETFDSSFKQMMRAQVPAATSVVLQGSKKTSTQTLFLFPDGSGSATSYIYLPIIAKDLLVIGLNSPYLKNGDDMVCNWDELVQAYLVEVRRRQPHGPYNFGGWSAGGALAYRAAQILIQEGEQVRDLILLDAPPPQGLGELPQHFYDYCESVGLFKPSGKTPKWLLSHFKAMNRVLHSYHAAPLPNACLRKVHILWAARSMLDGMAVPPMPTRPDDPIDMHFLTKTRQDFTAGAWGRLFPGVDVRVQRAEGVNHFTLLKDIEAAKVSLYIANALA